MDLYCIYLENIYHKLQVNQMNTYVKLLEFNEIIINIGRGGREV